MFYHFCREIGAEYTAEQNELLDLWLRQSRALHWWFPYKSIVLISERHNTLHVDDRGRLHCETGHAVGYPDGFGIWAWHGVIVPRDVIEHPECITAQMIIDETNAEVRRVMLEKFGHDRFIEEAGATLLHKDEIGELYQVRFDDDEPLTMVRVLNSTPEPDGSRKTYWLRVNPELRPLSILPDGTQKLGEPQAMRARNAVASTFGMTGEEYAQSLMQQT